MAQAPHLRAVPEPAATPMPLDQWPITGDAPDIRTIVEDQATTIAAQAALIDAYQNNLNVAQHPLPGAPVTGQGTTTGTSTSLVVTAATGPIVTGSSISGTGIPTTPVTTVLGFISGASPNGTYLLSNPVTLTSSTLVTFTPPPPASTWPIPNDALTLMEIQQTQTAILRVQSALIQHYQDLLNQSQTPAPPTGP